MCTPVRPSWMSFMSTSVALTSMLLARSCSEIWPSIRTTRLLALGVVISVLRVFVPGATFFLRGLLARASQAGAVVVVRISSIRRPGRRATSLRPATVVGRRGMAAVVSAGVAVLAAPLAPARDGALGSSI